MWKYIGGAAAVLVGAAVIYALSKNTVVLERQDVRMKVRHKATAKHADSNKDFTGKSFREWVDSIEQRLIHFEATEGEFAFVGVSTDDGKEYKWELFLKDGVLTAYVDDTLIVNKRLEA